MPDPQAYTEISKVETFYFALFLLFSFALLIVFAMYSYRLQNQKRACSPYSGLPMRRGEEVPLRSVEAIMRFLYYTIHNYDNQVFPMRSAMVCRETGRIFPSTVSWWGFQKVDWTFLQKRYPGVYVSWGSLTEALKQEIMEVHDSLEGFQTEKSSPNPAPNKISSEYAFLKPGPLYVDLNTKNILGWKCVPDTFFEVLILQKPNEKGTMSIDRILSIKEKK